MARDNKTCCGVSHSIRYKDLFWPYKESSSPGGRRMLLKHKNLASMPGQDPQPSGSTLLFPDSR